LRIRGIVKAWKRCNVQHWVIEMITLIKILDVLHPQEIKNHPPISPPAKNFTCR
jgi:hypothetical protein